MDLTRFLNYLFLGFLRISAQLVAEKDANTLTKPRKHTSTRSAPQACFCFYWVLSRFLRLFSANSCAEILKHPKNRYFKNGSSPLQKEKHPPRSARSQTEHKKAHEARTAGLAGVKSRPYALRAPRTPFFGSKRVCESRQIRIDLATPRVTDPETWIET